MRALQLTAGALALGRPGYPLSNGRLPPAGPLSGATANLRTRWRLDAKHDSATGHVSWPGTPMQSWRCSVDLLRWTSSLCGIGIAAPAQPGRRCCRGAKRSAVGMCRRHFPWSASASAQRRRREVIGTRAQQKKGAPPRRAAHRMAPSAISSPSSSATARLRRVRRRRTADRLRSAR